VGDCEHSSGSSDVTKDVEFLALLRDCIIRSTRNQLVNFNS
jgi:hypothetical protein